MTLKMRFFFCATTFLLLAALSGCAISPEAKEAKYIKRGQESFAAKQYTRAAIDFKNAARQMPKHAEAYYRLGLTYLELGDGQTGVGFLQQALALDPKHTPAKVKLAELMAFDQRPDVVREAERMSGEAARSAKDNADAMATLALAELRLGKEADAETKVRQILERSPEHFKSSTVLAASLMSKGDVDGAERVMREAAARNSRSAQPELALARLAAMRKNFPEVENHLRRAIHIEPGNEQALLDLGGLQLQMGKKEEAGKTYEALAKAPGGRYKSAHALFLFNTGEKEAGIRELEELCHRFSSERDLRTQLIAAYFSTGKYQQGEKELTGALKKNEEDVDALVQRSELELRRGGYEDAEKDLTRALRFQPDSARTHFLLARVHASQGNFNNEKRELSEALTHDPALLPARIEMAQALVRSGAASAALDLLDKAPAGDLHTLPWIVERNWVLLDMHNAPEVRKGVEEGLAKAHTPDLLLQDAIYCAESKDLTRARTRVQEALSQAPGDVRALDLLIRILNAQKDRTSALRTVQSLVNQQHVSAATQLYAGNYLLRTGHRPEARAAFAKAKAANPELPAPDYSSAQVDILDGKLDSARSTLAGLIERHSDANNARVLLGMVEEQSGHYDRAVEQFRKVLESEPNNVTALNNLAFRLANNLDRADEALTYAQKAKELDSRSPSVDDSLGWVFYRKGLYANAVTYLQSAVSKQATPVREYHLAMAYAKLGNRKKAEEFLQRARKTDPSLPEARMAGEMVSASR